MKGLIEAISTDLDTNQVYSAQTFPASDGHVNLRVGAALPNGRYSVQIVIHRKDLNSTPETRTAFRYDVGALNTVVSWTPPPALAGLTPIFWYKNGATYKHVAVTTAMSNASGGGSGASHVQLSEAAPAGSSYAIEYRDANGRRVAMATGAMGSGAVNFESYAYTSAPTTGASIAGYFMQPEEWSGIDYIEATVTDLAGNAIGSARTYPATENYNGQVNLIVGKPLPNGSYKVRIDIHKIDLNQAVESRTIDDYQVGVSSVSWTAPAELAGYTMRFSYQRDASGPMTAADSASITRNGDSYQVQIDGSAPEGARYAIEYYAGPDAEQGTDLSVLGPRVGFTSGTIGAVGNERIIFDYKLGQAAGEPKAGASLLRYLSEDEASEIVYIKTTITDPENPGLSFGTALTLPEYGKMRALQRGEEYDGRLNLTIGQNLEVGRTYKVTMEIHRKDVNSMVEVKTIEYKAGSAPNAVYPYSMTATDYQLNSDDPKHDVIAVVNGANTNFKWPQLKPDATAYLCYKTKADGGYVFQRADSAGGFWVASAPTNGFDYTIKSADGQVRMVVSSDPFKIADFINNVKEKVQFYTMDPAPVMTRGSTITIPLAELGVAVSDIDRIETRRLGPNGMVDMTVPSVDTRPGFEENYNGEVYLNIGIPLPNGTYSFQINVWRKDSTGVIKKVLNYPINGKIPTYQKAVLYYQAEARKPGSPLIEITPVVINGKYEAKIEGTVPATGSRYVIRYIDKDSRIVGELDANLDTSKLTSQEITYFTDVRSERPPANGANVGSSVRGLIAPAEVEKIDYIEAQVYKFGDTDKTRMLSRAFTYPQYEDNYDFGVNLKVGKSLEDGRYTVVLVIRKKDPNAEFETREFSYYVGDDPDTVAPKQPYVKIDRAQYDVSGTEHTQSSLSVTRLNLHSPTVSGTTWIRDSGTNQMVETNGGLSIIPGQISFDDRTPTSVKATIYQDGVLVAETITEVGVSEPERWSWSEARGQWYLNDSDFATNVAERWKGAGNWAGQANLVNSTTTWKNGKAPPLSGTYTVVLEAKDDAGEFGLDEEAKLKKYDEDGVWSYSKTISIDIGAPVARPLSVSWLADTQPANTSVRFGYRLAHSGTDFRADFMPVSVVTSQSERLTAMLGVIESGTYDYQIQYVDQYGKVVKESKGDSFKFDANASTNAVEENKPITFSGSVITGTKTDIGTSIYYLDQHERLGIDRIEAIITNRAVGNSGYTVNTIPDAYKDANGKPDYQGQVNLRVGSELSDGSYSVVIKIHRKDGTVEVRPSFVYEIGEQSKKETLTTLYWNSPIPIAQYPGMAVTFSFVGADGKRHSKLVSPDAPDNLHKVELTGLDVGDHAFTIRYYRSGAGELLDNGELLGNEILKEATGTFTVKSPTDSSRTPDFSVNFVADNGDRGLDLSLNLKARVNKFEYDKAGRLEKSYDATSTAANNVFEEYRYDALGNKTYFRNKAGAEWTYEYDANGRLRLETNPAVAVTTMDGQSATATTVSKVLQTRYTYDALGNVLTRTEADGPVDATGSVSRTTTYEYDALGHQVKTMHPAIKVYQPEETLTSIGTIERVESLTPVTPITTVIYNPLGQAVVNIDADGKYSYKVYGKLGRLCYEVDAERYVTEYAYDTFGNQTSLIRHATALVDLKDRPESELALALTLDDVKGWLNAQTTEQKAGSRRIDTIHDKRNRVQIVTEPTVYTYDSSANQHADAAAQTKNVYNAFGQLIKQSALRSNATSTNAAVWEDTYFYYDDRGNKNAQIDPMGYLTTWKHDAAGNVTSQIEYAKALKRAATGADVSVQAGWDTAIYAAPEKTSPQNRPDAETGYDRETRYTYDLADRKLQETHINAEFSVLDQNKKPDTDFGNVTTAVYEYDKLGNVIGMKDGEGSHTRTYYDALGRVIAIVAPAVDASSSVIEFAYDAFGNVTRQIRYANGGVAGPSYTAPAKNDANDQISYNRYDAQGHVIQAIDARGDSTYTSYDILGRAAKQWRPQTDYTALAAQNTVQVFQNAVQVFHYDALGRTVATIEPSTATDSEGVSLGAFLTTKMRYNAFGEMTGRNVKAYGSIDGYQAVEDYQEYFDYDNAGRMWRTNGGDGVDKVYLYDLEGRKTADIRSETLDLHGFGSAGQVATLTGNVIRNNTVYDLNGHAIRQELAGFTVRQEEDIATIDGSVGYQPSSLTVGTPSSSVMNGYSWNGVNKLEINWSPMTNWGNGEVRVELAYLSGVYLTHGDNSMGTETGFPQTYSQVFPYDKAITGATLVWEDNNSSPEQGGISTVTGVRLYKKDIDGKWQLVLVQNSDRSVPNSIQLFMDVPTGLGVSAQMRYRSGSSGAWINAEIKNFGGKLVANLEGLATGSHEYQVLYYQRDPVFGLPDSTPYAIADGTFSVGGGTGTVGFSNSLGTTIAITPVINQTTDRWGNVVAVSNAGNAAAITHIRYDHLNHAVEQTQPEVEVTGINGVAYRTKPVTLSAYDKAGRLIATTDANGNVTGYRYNQAGQLEEESHADGGSVEYEYDKLGRKATMTDANDKVTKYRYDKLDRILDVEHPIDSITTIIEKNFYDEMGNVIKRINGMSETEVNVYDTHGNLTTSYSGALTNDGAFGRTDVSNAVKTTMRHDARGNKVFELNANGDSMKWRYDYFGRLKEHTDLGNTVTHYEHNENGQVTEQTGASDAGQNISYSYYENGALKKINDRTLSAITEYEYDGNGQRTREKFTKGSTIYQDNRIDYDDLGRITSVLNRSPNLDAQYSLAFRYDANGNRRNGLVKYYDAQDSTKPLKTVDNWYLYDSQNRITLSQGVLKDGSIQVTMEQGIQLGYDQAGNRKRAFSYADKKAVLETYLYDDSSRLKETSKNGVLDSKREYDRANRVISLTSGEGGPSDKRLVQTYSYNDSTNAYENNKGWLTTQTSAQGGNTSTVKYSFNKVGNVDQYIANGKTYRYTYAAFDTYKEASIIVDDDSSTTAYDVNGNIMSVSDPQNYKAKERAFVTTQNGQILQKRTTDSADVLTTQNYFFVNDQSFGSNGGDGNADFDFNYTPISAQYPAATPSHYVVSSGDNLPGIAAAVYGDAQLWYLIADANGLQSDSPLTAGKSLIIPNHVTNLRNAYDTFKPYDAGGVIGDTTPTLPMPSNDGGCGGLGQIVMAIAALVATAFSAGLLSGAAGSFAQIMTSGTAFLSGAATAATGTLGMALGTFGTAALSAAVGSVASQVVGNAIGAQNGFSWKSVGLAAVSGGISGGLAGVDFVGSSGGNAVVRAAIGSTLTQGVAVGTGLQPSFSWRGVAAASVGAGVGSAVGGALGLNDPNTPMGFGERLFKSSLTGFAAGATTAAMHGGRISATQIAVDSFGQAVANSLVDNIGRAGQQYTELEQAQDFVRENARFARQAAMNAQLGKPLLLADSGQFMTDVGSLYGDVNFGEPVKPNATSDAMFDVLVKGMQNPAPAAGPRIMLDDFGNPINMNGGMPGNWASFAQADMESGGLKLKMSYMLGSGTDVPRNNVWEKLNANFGTSIDFSALSQFEGGQKLNGYVPMNKGVVLGKSGVTIATGFDIGQMTPSGIESLGFKESLEEKLIPYAFPKIREKAVVYLKDNPLIITRDDANDIDYAIKARHLSSALNSWNKSRLDFTPSFENLTPAQQTVIFSRTFHQGMGMPRTPIAQDFYSAALANRWDKGEVALRNYAVNQQWYKNRVAAEANLLKQERIQNEN